MAFPLKAALAIALLGACAAAATERPDTTMVNQARVLLTKGDRAGATSAVERALKRQPRNAEALVLGGNLVRDLHGVLAALPWYDRALAVQPGHIDALFEKAATQGDAGRAVAMLATTRQLLVTSPRNPRAFYLQAVLAMRAGEWELARSLLYRIGKRMPDVPGVALLRGTTELRAGANDAAIQSLRPLVEQQPGNAKLRRLLGLALWRAGAGPEAIDVLRPLNAGGDPYALAITGRVLERLGNRTDAAAALDRARQSERTAPDAAIIDALDDFLATNPDNPWAQRAAADRAMSRGEWEAAAAIFASLDTRLGARDPVRMINAGWADVGRKRYDDAVALGAAAYALAPMSALVTASYGSFLARAGDAERAVPLLEKAVAMAPGEARFVEELAAARKAP